MCVCVCNLHDISWPDFGESTTLRAACETNLVDLTSDRRFTRCFINKNVLKSRKLWCGEKSIIISSATSYIYCCVTQLDSTRLMLFFVYSPAALLAMLSCNQSIMNVMNKKEGLIGIIKSCCTACGLRDSFLA